MVSLVMFIYLLMNGALVLSFSPSQHHFLHVSPSRGVNVGSGRFSLYSTPASGGGGGAGGSGGSGKKKRKRRRRKKDPETSTGRPPVPDKGEKKQGDMGGVPSRPTLERGAVDLPSIKKSVASRKSDGGAPSQGAKPKEEASSTSDAVPGRFASVSRADAEGLKLLLESDPTGFDPSPARTPTKNSKKARGLNSEDYSVVSLALGEGGRSFFSVPFAALQIGHGILALVLILIATVDYPGFPLTSLPPSIRDAIGASLLVTYGINFLLAVYVLVFEVGRREAQADKGALWFIKTLAVGGLGLDQIRQFSIVDE